MRSEIRRRELCVFFLVYLAIACWWLWPIPRDLTTHLIELPHRVLNRADFRLLVWALSWDAHALVTQPWNLFNANTFYPAPYSLAYSEHLLGYAPLFAPTYWLTRNPVLATNVLILLIFALRGLGMYVFARLFVPAPAAALAGVVFGFPATTTIDIAMFHVQGFFYLPFALFFTARWLDRGQWRYAALLAAALFLQATTSAYLGFALAFAYGAALPFLVADARERLDRRRILGLVSAGGLAVLGAALLALPYLWLKSVGLVPEYGDDNLPAGLVMAPAKINAYLHAGVGALTYALAALALLPRWSGRRPVVILMGLALLLTGFVVASGPRLIMFGRIFWSPYGLLTRVLPGFSTVRMPARLMVVAQLGLALLTALGVARIVPYLPRSVAWGCCIAAAAFILLHQTPRDIVTARYPVGDQVPAVYRVLAGHDDGRALLELPRPTWDRASERMVLSTTHWLPMVDGYSGYTPQTDDYLQAIARYLPDEGALQHLVDTADIGWIIVHTSEMAPEDAARWLGPLPEGLKLVGRYGSDLLFVVRRRMLFNHRALLVSTDQTLDGRPRELVRAPCPGDIRVMDDPSTPWKRGKLTPLTVQIDNHGTQTWPAAGVIPKRLVRLRVCLGKGARPYCETRLRSFPHDVLPGASVSTVIDVLAPRMAGDYTLRLELDQVLGTHLESCGVEPLEMKVRVR